MEETVTDHPDFAFQNGREGGRQANTGVRNWAYTYGCEVREFRGTVFILIFRAEAAPGVSGVISSIVLQVVSSFTPDKGHTVGPDGLVACAYVDDGVFDEPCVELRHRLSVSVGEFGLTQCLEKKAPSSGQEKRPTAHAPQRSPFGHWAFVRPVTPCPYRLQRSEGRKTFLPIRDLAWA